MYQGILLPPLASSYNASRVHHAVHCSWCPATYLEHLPLSFAANVHKQTFKSHPTSPCTANQNIELSYLSDDMVPDFLPNKHVQYKEDTNKFIIWLVDTAKKVSYTRKSPRPTPTTTVPRLKGRARKDAQKTASMPKKETEVRGKVSLQDILHLAKTVVAKTSPRKISPCFTVHPQICSKRYRCQATVRRMVSNTGGRPICFTGEHRSARLLHSDPWNPTPEFCTSTSVMPRICPWPQIMAQHSKTLL